MATAYLALRDGLLVVGDADGESPTATERLADRTIECVAAAPATPDRVFVGSFESGLFRSTDGGDSFGRVGDGTIEQDAVMSAAVSPHNPDEVWVGTEPSRLYRSTDGGDSFERVEGIVDLPSEPEWSFPPRPHTHHVRWIEPDPRDPGRLYVGIEAGALLVTPDAGGSWTERPPGSRRDNHTLATHPDAGGRVYSAAGDGYAESTDAGLTWDHPEEGLDHRYVWGLAVDPGDPEVVVVSAAAGARQAHREGGAYLYRKRNGGRWERLDDRGVPTGEGARRAVLAAGTDPGELYAANDHGIYRTVDAGDSWRRLGVASRERFAGLTTRGLAVVGE